MISIVWSEIYEFKYVTLFSLLPVNPLNKAEYFTVAVPMEYTLVIEVAPTAFPSIAPTE